MKKNKWFLSFLIMLISLSIQASTMPPLTLIDFTAIQTGNKVDIKWRTSIETGGPYFTIEKSKDGKEYVKVVDLPETEGGTVYSDYYESDYQPFAGVSYYRIKQTDAAGNFRYSQIVILKIEDDKVLSADNISKDETLLVLRDSNGNDFYSKAVITTEKNKIYATNAASAIPVGTYYVVGSSNEELYSGTLIVK
ncbi:MAG: hypothetical protein ABI388_00850 [Bacteroidia bacterium]